jgi:catechol 2,3-dioxygenase-like lactoylglutathione lyase family enzyme
VEEPVIDHLTLKVRDLAKSKALLSAALAPLGYEVLMDLGGAIGMGADQKPDLWLAQDPDARPMHLAFAASSRQAVDAFHAAALAAGAKDNGGPGLRTDYHPSYYAAFVLDPDGHNLEAVTHRPE